MREAWSMGKIVCEKCGTEYKFEVAKNFDCCPVCGASFSDETIDKEKEMQTFYYYKEGGGMLDNTLSSKFTPLYTFQAVDMKDAERQLKEILPNSPLFSSSTSSKTRCPRCHSTEIQLVPRKFSLLTGFATNRFDRMCVRCQKKF